MSSHAREGASAPDFTLQGPAGPFTLSQQRGRTVLLLFYPGDETPVCTRQFCSYRDRAEEIDALDAVVVGISAKDVASKERFASRHGLNVPLLADPDHAVARAYGVHGPLGVRRATIVVDATGRIRARVVHRLGLTYETVDDLRALIAEVAASGSQPDPTAQVAG